jgi:hypothetical protein
MEGRGREKKGKGRERESFKKLRRKESGFVFTSCPWHPAEGWRFNVT